MSIKVRDIAFVRFQAPDLDSMETFLVGFGLVRAQRTDTALYMRATDDEGFVHVTHLGAEPAFVGLAFVADSEVELDVLAAGSAFSAVVDLDGPGGGRVVRGTDPDGFQVEVVAGRASVGRLPVPGEPVRNNAAAHGRTGAPLRLEPGPAHVKRLGHCAIEVADYAASTAWYQQHLGLVTSDEMVIEGVPPLGAFVRCDRGEQYVDHHTMALIGLGAAKFNHAAFEVAHFDDLMLGHTHLQSGGYTHQFGIGRHILGSQIFDYWRDPYGHVVEHWTDGDLFNNETPPNVAGIEMLLGSQWGPTSGEPPH